MRLLAPVLTFTCDEAWSYATAGVEYADGSVHLEDWPEAPAAWTDAAVEADLAALLKVRAQVNEAIEPLRAGGKLGKSLDAAITLTVPSDDPAAAALARHRDALPELFIVSHVDLATGSGARTAAVRPCAELGHARCPRCWRWVPALQPTSHGATCPRCAEALAT